MSFVYKSFFFYEFFMCTISKQQTKYFNENIEMFLDKMNTDIFGNCINPDKEHFHIFLFRSIEL